MDIRVAITFIFCLGLHALEFVIVPDHEPCVETLFSRSEIGDYKSAPLWDKVRYLLNKNGHTVSTAKISDIKDKSDVRFVIWNGSKDVKKFLSKIKKEHLFLLVFEPPSVLPYLHTKEYLDRFSRVLTWEDDRIDGHKFRKYYHPVCYPMISDVVPFKERKLCAIMAANKKSKFKGEIYTERRKAIEYFDRYPDQFDLYGPGWGKEGLQTYKGMVDDKINTLKKYKFSLCYENTVGMKGYITEKIFDCLYAGVVPVYLGAPNILEEIPANCFIDRRNFPSYEELQKHLLTISEEEFSSYLSNMRAFLISHEARKYTTDGFALSLVNGLTGLSLNWDDLPN